MFPAAKELQTIKHLLRLQASDSTSQVDHEEEAANADLQELLKQLAWDDVSGAQLDFKKVMEARAEEIMYAEKKHVWKKITRAEARRQGLNIIKTRWIDINKGDAQREQYRSRLVAKGIQ